jgi:hypothetical protein
LLVLLDFGLARLEDPNLAPHHEGQFKEVLTAFEDDDAAFLGLSHKFNPIYDLAGFYKACTSGDFEAYAGIFENVELYLESFQFTETHGGDDHRIGFPGYEFKDLSERDKISMFTAVQRQVTDRTIRVYGYEDKEMTKIDHNATPEIFLKMLQKDADKLGLVTSKPTKDDAVIVFNLD